MTEQIKQEDIMRRWFQMKATSLPNIEKGILKVDIQTFRREWPDFTVYPPNPLFDHLPLTIDVSKGKEKQTISISPHEVYMIKKLCFWVPDVFFNKIIPFLPCPSCHKKKKSDYFTLRSDGWGGGPRRVYCHTGSYYIVSKRYRCSKCGDKYIGYDSEVTALLPDSVGAFLPCVVTSNCALDIMTFKLLKRQVVSGQSFDDFAEMINEMCVGMYYHKQYVYYAETFRRNKHRIRSFGMSPNIPAFGTLDGSFGHRSIEAEYLRTVYCVDGARDLPWITQRLSMVDGEILAVDHSFKAAKKIKIQDELSRKFIPAFGATLTVFNEYHQVSGQYLTRSKSYKDVQVKFKALLDRYEVYKYNKPLVIYTDNCCNDKSDLTIFDDAMVRLDAFHFMDRYFDGCKQRHPSFTSFCKELRKAIFVIHDSSD
jgi:hypothetical protein